eukprot:6212657-Pleurochrysis_carterae.AAC.2
MENLHSEQVCINRELFSVSFSPICTDQAPCLRADMFIEQILRHIAFTLYTLPFSFEITCTSKPAPRDTASSSSLQQHAQWLLEVSGKAK